MSKEIISEVFLDGKTIKHFNSITIRQLFNAHHQFELILDQDVLEETGSQTMDNTLAYVGKTFTVCFGQKDSGDNIFKGIVTDVSLQQRNGLWGTLVLKGFSPTYLMDGGAHYTSYENIDLRTLIEECSKNVAGSDMTIEKTPAYTSTISYLCQYGESDFNFINRISSEFGEWFFYDGNKLLLGRPKKQEMVELVYGEDISDLNFSLKFIPDNIIHYSYNSKEDNLLSASLPGRVDNANEYTNKALEVSGKLFRKTVHQPTNVRVSTMGDLDFHNKIQKGKHAASTVLLEVEGDNPKVKLGHNIKLKTPKPEKGKGFDEQGDFVVINLTHTISGTGEYANAFEAIPSRNEVIPYNIPKPVAEPQVAIVTENADPENMGRVRVQMIWQQENNLQTDWVRVVTPNAGSSNAVNKNRGCVFVPEIGDQVMIGFRYNDPNRPFVMGSIFHGTNGEGGSSQNTIKSIKTRSGHTIEFNDAEDGTSITIKDKSGNSIFLDTKEKNISITAPETMTFTCKNMVMNIEESMTTKIGKDMKTTIGANHKLTISGKSEISSNETKETVKENKSVTISGDLKVKTASTKLTSDSGDILIKSAGVATLQGTSDAKVNKG